ncbi:MAG: Ca-activated chloride channel family protein [Arenicella sp.]|jgi:Ca-activated chloride channel family protein
MDLEFNLEMIEQFHFIRPDWLWLLPLALLAWLILRNQRGGQQWSSHIPKAMLAALQISTAKQSSAWKWSLLALWLGVIVAAAGPTWDKQASPTVQNQKALVIALDLSPSMLAQDLTPDRLSRAKYKLIDVLRQQTDGQVALIAYAGDAHTVSPLTDDPRTIEALLPALHPNVMPSRGSNTEAAIELAQQLMRDAGLNSGELLLITDGVTSEAINTISDSISSNYRLSILAAGSNAAAPIPSTGGGFLRRANGEIILSLVNRRELAAMATRLGGRFSMLTADDSDIENLLIGEFQANSDPAETQQSSVTYDAWVDMGHWLVLLILPLALVLFRKGTIYLLPLCLPLLLLSPTESYADTPIENAWQTSWNNLWKTPDQQASKQFTASDFESAGKTFERRDWSALSSYKNRDYQQAIDTLEGLNDVTSIYNKANALALNGQLPEAIEAYQQVLALQPEHQPAKHNKAIVEQLKQQQDDQEGQPGEGDPSEGQPGEGDPDEGDPSQGEAGEGDPSQGEPDEGDPDEGDPSQDEPGEGDPDEGDPSQGEPGEGEQAEDKPQTEAGATDDSEDQSGSEETVLGAQSDDTDKPLKDSSEQWLRTIQDDPSGLLRRKFDYQARQRAQQARPQKNEKAAQQRY